MTGWRIRPYKNEIRQGWSAIGWIEGDRALEFDEVHGSGVGPTGFDAIMAEGADERRMKPLLLTNPLVVSAFALLWASPLSAQAQEAESLRTGAFGDWIVHRNAGDGPKICFAASQPKIKEPAGANRSKIVLYVSAWPKEGVKSEVSVKLGYPVKPDSPVDVTVGDAAFQLFPDQDRAYVADSTEELKLVEAMKRGSTMVVKATSTRGTLTTDTYSLNGLGKALEAVAAACP